MSPGPRMGERLARPTLGELWTFQLRPDGTGEGVGPDGVVHQKFRHWKEALRDA